MKSEIYIYVFEIKIVEINQIDNLKSLGREKVLNLLS